MAESDNNIQTLLNEFTNITIDIKVKETWSDDIYNPIIEIDEESDLEIILGFPKFWDFTLTFNQEYTVESNNIKDLKQKAVIDYHVFIEDKKSRVYQELDDLIISKNTTFEKRNYLNSLKLRFKELLKSYQYISVDKRLPFYKLLGNVNAIRSISEEKVVYSLLEKKLVNSFLTEQRKTIKSLNKYIEKKLLLLNKQVKGVKQNQDGINNIDIKEVQVNGVRGKKQTSTAKSFELVPDPKEVKNIHERLHAFHKELEDKGFIKQIHHRLFIKVFTNQEVEQPIVWIKKPNELYHLIKTLYDKRIIRRFKNYWQVACNCFILEKNNAEIKIIPSFIARNKSPKDRTVLKNLNAVIIVLE